MKKILIFSILLLVFSSARAATAQQLPPLPIDRRDHVGALMRKSLAEINRAFDHADRQVFESYVEERRRQTYFEHGSNYDYPRQECFDYGYDESRARGGWRFRVGVEIGYQSRNNGYPRQRYNCGYCRDYFYSRREWEEHYYRYHARGRSYENDHREYYPVESMERREGKYTRYVRSDKIQPDINIDDIVETEPEPRPRTSGPSRFQPSAPPIPMNEREIVARRIIPSIPQALRLEITYYDAAKQAPQTLVFTQNSPIAWVNMYEGDEPSAVARGTINNQELSDSEQIKIIPQYSQSGDLLGWLVQWPGR